MFLSAWASSHAAPQHEEMQGIVSNSKQGQASAAAAAAASVKVKAGAGAGIFQARCGKTVRFEDMAADGNAIRQGGGGTGGAVKQAVTMAAVAPKPTCGDPEVGMAAVAAAEAEREFGQVMDGGKVVYDDGYECGEAGRKPSKLAKLRRRVLSVQQLWIWPFTHYKPTNQVMLCYRTLFQDLRSRGANSDHLAATFRDELMPLRGWVHRKLPALLRINRAFIQGPATGCPGVMRYLDARTRWLDGEVEAAQREGFTQIVVLAAGYDTRAYRLAAPDVSYFEVDLPEASERKRQLVERTLPADQFPRPTYIAADLSQVSVAGALLGAASASSSPIASSSTSTITSSSSSSCGVHQSSDNSTNSSNGRSAARRFTPFSFRSGHSGSSLSSATGTLTAAAAAAADDDVTTAPRVSDPNSYSSDTVCGPNSRTTTNCSDSGDCFGRVDSGDGSSNSNSTAADPRQLPTRDPQTPQFDSSGLQPQQQQPQRFDPKARTLFTVEGLLYYLPPQAVTKLLASIRTVAAPGSRIAFDFLHQDVFSGHRWEPGYETLRLTVANKGEPKRSGLDPAALPAYLSRLGWRLTQLPSPREVAAGMYAHRKWSRLNPVLPPFYNFAVAEAN